jgi:hypothetical protein
MGDFLSGLSSEQTGALVGEALKLVPAVISFSQANKAKRQQKEYLRDIKRLEKNRQKVTNPYANLSNPYANLSVATKAADIQAEQSDIALANTLDTLRATGAAAGGATALAQAALKSKQNVSASIEKQEVLNEKLKAQGQMQVDMAKAKGEAIRFRNQERRDDIQLDRLQSMADIEAQRRAQGVATGASALTSMAGGIADALINPQADSISLGDAPAAEIPVEQPETQSDLTAASNDSSMNPNMAYGLSLATNDPGQGQSLNPGMGQGSQFNVFNNPLSQFVSNNPQLYQPNQQTLDLAPSQDPLFSGLATPAIRNAQIAQLISQNY